MNDNGGHSIDGDGKTRSFLAQEFEKVTINTPDSSPRLPRSSYDKNTAGGSLAIQERRMFSASGSTIALESPSKRAISFQKVPGQSFPPSGKAQPLPRQEKLSKNFSKDGNGASLSKTFENNKFVSKPSKDSMKHCEK